MRKFYGPILETNYDHVQPRLRDLEQLEQIAGRWRSRRRMLLEMALDPPNSTQDFAGPPLLDDDYLVLSTIHSAKGLEWDAVYVIHAADGNIPSDMSTKDTAGVEEERRLFYVALTRAKNWLYVLCPLRYYHSYRPGASDRYGMAQRTRFLPESVLKYFDRQITSGMSGQEDDAAGSLHLGLTSKAIRGRRRGCGGERAMLKCPGLRRAACLPPMAAVFSVRSMPTFRHSDTVSLANFFCWSLTTRSSVAAAMRLDRPRGAPSGAGKWRSSWRRSSRR